MHLEQTTEAVAAAGPGIDDRGALFRHAGIDADERELADVRVVHDLEDQRGERLVVAAVTGDGSFGIGIGALGFPDVDRGRQIIDDGVEEELDALVLERGAAERGNELAGDDGVAEGGLDLLLLRGLAFEVEFHDGVVDFGETLDQVIERLLGLLLIFRGDVVFDDLRAVRAFVAVGLLVDDLDVAAEVGFGPDGKGDRHDGRAELLAHFIDDTVEIRAGTVHLVDERENRHVVFLGLTPHGFRLGLDAADRAEDGDGAVEHAEGALDLGSEVDVTGSVDEVDAMLQPEAGGGGGRNGDAAFLFLDHPVHRSSAFMDLAHLVALAGVVEDTLGKRGLAGVDVSHDPDVAGGGECGLAAGSLVVILIECVDSSRHRV